MEFSTARCRESLCQKYGLESYGSRDDLQVVGSGERIGGRET